MEYVYEKENIRKLNSFNLLLGGVNITKPIYELQEVYRKAKAFNKIANLIESNYVDYGDYTLEDIEAIVNEYWEDK